jgi:hypothetical protein
VSSATASSLMSSPRCSGATDVDELGERVCVGSAEHCAKLLSRYARAGCRRVYLWPLGDERQQIELAGAQVAPRIDS